MTQNKDNTTLSCAHNTVTQCLSKTVFTRRQSAYFESWFEMRILNHDSKYGIWTVCTPNHVEIRDLRCASQITVQRCFRVMHLKSRISTWFGVHTVQNTVFWIVIQDAHLESRLKSRFKIRTLPSCENSLIYSYTVGSHSTSTRTIILSFHKKKMNWNGSRPSGAPLYYPFKQNKLIFKAISCEDAFLCFPLEKLRALIQG